MKANELRIGNLFNPRIPTAIEWWMLNPQYDIVLEPIPLTEEWLLKFGFVEDDCFGDNFLRHKKAISITVSAIHSNGEIHIQIGNYPVSIRYVHQLQNLYFALKSEELTLSK